MKNLVFIAILLFAAVTLNAQTPEIMWSYDTYDASFGQSAAGDIDGDGRLEVVFGCYRNDSSVYALNLEDGTLLWKVNTRYPGYEGCNDVAPLIYDVDGDGVLDVIVPSSCNPTTYCFNGPDGEIKWQTPTSGSDSPPTISDIDGDGDMEIMHGGFDGHVMCLNAIDGNVEWSLAVDEDSWVQTAPTIVDLDGDGLIDFVVASEKSDTNRVYAYKGIDHTPLWQYTMADWVYHGTAVADLDQDGKPELVLGDYEGNLVALNGEDGSEAWTYTYSTSGGYYVGSPATIADLDGDGHCELVFCNWFKIIALRDDGTMFWNYSIPDYETAFRGAVLSDVDNDGLPDAVFGTSGGLVMALSGLDGSLLWSVDLQTHYGMTFPIDHAPVIADFDGDGGLDLFIVGGHAEYPDFFNDYGRAYALSIGQGTGPDWLMFQNNIHRTGSICETSVSVNENIKQQAFASINVYPNPFAGSVNIEIFNPQKTDVKIEISDIYGRLVNSTGFAENGQDFFSFKWNGENQEGSIIPAGMYFLKVKCSGVVLTNKILK